MASTLDDYVPVVGSDSDALLLVRLRQVELSGCRKVALLLATAVMGATGFSAKAALYDARHRSKRTEATPEERPTWGMVSLEALSAERRDEPYICQLSYGKGLGRWETVWSDAQKKWCCEEKGLGCPATTPYPFDCNAGYGNWVHAWSHKKMDWCCRNAGRACNTSRGNSALTCWNSTKTLTQGPGLFCFVIMRGWEGCYEVELMREQLKRCAGIFGCEEWTVLSDSRVLLSKRGVFPEIWTQSIPTRLSRVAGDSHNAPQYVHVWDMILNHDQRHKRLHWVVKTDPDAVFFPNRLRLELRKGAFTHESPMFFANCPATCRDIGPHNGQSFMYGAIEVISTKAIELFASAYRNCRSSIPVDRFEEEFATECLSNYAHVPQHQDLHIPLLREWDYCQSPYACTANSVAFHPFSGKDVWFKCWSESSGQSEADAHEVAAMT